ncbi:MAG: DUF3786 domain-containing protein [Chloroflexi bacterium]|nr:DUF3786 domain-containing protein [Chloroflexota bacterium]
MALDTALDKAYKDLAGVAPYVTAAKAGVQFAGGQFVVPFFDLTYLVSFPEIKVTEKQSGKRPPQWLELITLHYLITADGTPVADEWIPYRQLPGAFIFEQRFRMMAVDPILRAFGNDVEAFHRAARALKGAAMSRTGDAAYMFHVFAMVRLGCILYLGDDEVAPSVNLLFDGAAPHYLPTEDLSYLGSYLATALRAKKDQRTPADGGNKEGESHWGL